jgi:hypothetical protein
MMKRTGKLQTNGQSRLDDGTLLARCSEPDPIGSGTAFLKNKGLRDGDDIWVTGSDGNVGNAAAFCMDDAGLQVTTLAETVKAVSEKKRRTRKPLKRRKRKKSRRKAVRARKGKRS